MTDEKIFDVLYGYDNKNKIKEWKIKAKNMGTYSTINYSYGYISGRKTECTITISSGKNIGKRNETSHYQQAILDATSKWKKKIESGYTKDLSTLHTNINMIPKVKIEEETNLFPMLAHEYKKHHSKIKFPCYIQPKLDGYRMIYDHNTKRILSRTGKEYKNLYNTPLYEELVSTNLIFDGELYLHNCKFENYGILRKTKCLTLDEKIFLNKIEYHVYDIAYSSLKFEDRHYYLQQFFINNPQIKMIKMVDTRLCNNESDIDDYHKRYVSMNYEGSIIRNKDGLYKYKSRSFDLQKKKDFYDEEFEIVDYTSEKEQNDKNLIVWICKKDDKKFNVRPKGDKEERMCLFANGRDYIGKKLWVKFFEYTDSGVPRFPTTMRSSVKEYIRDLIN